jgi:hypothetical protein
MGKENTMRNFAVVAACIVIAAGCDQPEPFEPPPPQMHVTHGNVMPIITNLPCDDGGKIHVTGLMTNHVNAAGTGRLDIYALVHPRGCRWQGPNGIVTIDDAPLLIMRTSRARVDNVLANEITGDLRGRVTFSGAGDSGKCDVDVEFRIALAPRAAISNQAAGCSRILFELAFPFE